MRCSNEVMGMVNFPVDSEEYKSTGEGGMFVQLWCVEEEYFSCGACCGYNGTQAMTSEVLVGTDSEVNEDNFHEIESGKVDPANWVQRRPLQEKLYPSIANEEGCQQCRYTSGEMLACVTMGSTGWSGWSDKKEEYWRCRYDDLNEAGKGIYDSLMHAYPRGKLILVTWLDT